MSLTNPTYNELAQTAHFFAAFVIAHIAAHVFGWYALVGIVGYALVKEFWFDLKYETQEVSGGIRGGIMDAAFLIAGAICGVLLLRW
jgi:hypothetical protein